MSKENLMMKTTLVSTFILFIFSLFTFLPQAAFNDISKKNIKKVVISKKNREAKVFTNHNFHLFGNPNRMKLSNYSYSEF